METAKRQAQLLHLYLLELKNTLKKMDALNVLQRNPYIRSKAAKLVLQEVSESMQHCLDAQLVFLASVSRLQLSDEAGLKGVRGASQILFDFAAGNSASAAVEGRNTAASLTAVFDGK